MAQVDKKPSLEVASVTLLSQNPLSCNMCGKLFQSRRELLVHQWTHKERQMFYCPNCEKNFNNENQFKRHMHVHTREGKKYVTCDICKKVFRNNRVLEEHHVRDHTGTKPYRCGTCGIQFSWRENLKKHLQTHIDKPYACVICHESFKDEESLELHSKIHKREMKELEKRESERRELEDRERRRELHKQMGVFTVGPQVSDVAKVKEEEFDDDERGFKCKVCNQSFKYAFTLEAHMKGHIEEGVDVKTEEGEIKEEPLSTLSTLPPPKITANPVFDKPHTCDICNQTFRWAFCLDAHVKIHKQGYDAKVEKERERMAFKSAKEKRRQDALRKALAQHEQHGAEVGEVKQEGTVVIVVEPFTEEEKQEAADQAANGNIPRRRAPKANASKSIASTPNGSKSARKRTRREAMAEQLDMEGRQPDDFDENIAMSFGEFGDCGAIDSPMSDTKNVDSGDDGSGIDLKAPKLSITDPALDRVRGGAKTRGGAKIRNHIDLNDVVASIGKESRENLSRQRGGVHTRGGGRSRGGHTARQGFQPEIKTEEVEEGQEEEDEQDEEDEEIEDEEEEMEELQHEEGVEPRDDEEEGEEEEEDQEEEGDEESMDEGSDASSGYEPEEGEVVGADQMVDMDDIKSEHSDESQGPAQESGPEQSGAEQSDGEQSGAEQSDGEQSGPEQSEREQSGAEQSDGEQSGAEQSDGEQSGAEQSDGEQSGAQPSDAEQSGPEQSDGEQSDGEREYEEDSRGTHHGEEQDASGGEEEGVLEGAQYEHMEEGSGEEESGEDEEEEQESDVEGNEVETRGHGGEEEGEIPEELHGEFKEEEQESGSERVEEGGEEGDQEDDESVEEEEEGSHTSTQVNEAAQTMLGLDDSSDDDFDDDDEIIDDDVDEQELLKLKMKVYSCELCSKAFVQADLLMEHKVNYHQQNGDAVRTILGTKTPKVSPHTKVVSGPRSHSNIHRKSR